MDNKKNYLGLIGLFLVGCVGSLDISVVNIALPSIGRYFNSNLNSVMWIMLIFILVNVSILIPICKLGDMYGMKKVLLICLGIFTSASILCAVSNSLTILILGRGIQAVGASALITLSIPLAFNIFPKEKKNAIAGIWGAVCALATAIGPSLGGYIIQRFSWRYIFFINIPICIISFLLIFNFIKENFVPDNNKKIDFMGTIFLAAALSTLILSLTKVNAGSFTSKMTLGLLIISITCFAAFIILENFISNPIIDFSLFKIRSFLVSSCAFGFVTITSVIFSNFINFFFNGISNYTSSESGNIMFFFALGIMVSSIIAGKLTGRFKTSTVVLFSTVICMIAIFLVIHITPDTTKTDFIIILFIAGLGTGAPSGQLIASALSDIPNEKSGVASGLNNIIGKLFFLVLTAIMTCSLTYGEDIATNNTKKYLIKNISYSQVLDKGTKDIVIKDLSSINKNNFSSLQKKLGTKKYLAKTLKNTETEFKKNYSNAFTSTFKLGFIPLLILVLVCPFVNPDNKKTET